MTNMQIIRLRLENFKCHTLLELTPEGRSLAIYGDNAAGKTSVYDALTWLLFGKDSQGNGEKNIDIKPLDSTGAVADHSAITAVEAELAVDGERICLKRTYQEVWSTKRGSSAETFDGNTSEYFINGVPCKKFAFDDRIRQLVPEDTFRLLTSVSYFAKDLPWQKRREVLFDMAGTVDDRQILEGAPQFFALLEGMGKLSLEDYKKKLLAEKKGFVNAKTDIPARISECQKTVEDLAELDFPKAKAENEELAAQQSALAAQITAVKHNSLADSKRLDIREAQVQLDKLIAENASYRAKQSAGAPDVASLQNTLVRQKSTLANSQALLHADEQSVASYEKLIEESRQRWFAVNGEVFTDGACPTCGQQLPVEQLRQATESFEAGKQSRMREIERTAESQKHFLAETKNRIQKLQVDISSMEDQIRQTEEQIKEAQSYSVVPVDMDGFADRKAALDATISKLNEDLQALLQNSAAEKNRLSGELAAVNAKIRENMAICGKESALEYARSRIIALREEAQNASACLEAIEKMLYLMEEYTRYKTRVVEEGVNSLFSIARFRLFREQANGGVEERCDVTVDGVPYGSLNNGMKINVGIDVINALSRHYGITVPLFVDNAESVTKLERADAQVIRLVVSADDKKLRCEYENP